MFRANQLDQFLDTIAALPHPVLTIWTRTDQLGGGGPGEAARVRVRQLFGRVSGQLGDQLEPVRNQLLEALGRPAGSGTSMLVAARLEREQPEVISRHFPMSLAVGDAELPAEIHFGEPWLIPLRLAISESERVGVLEVHEQSVTLYETFLGEIELVERMSLPTMPGEHDRLQGSKPVHPAHIADRGGSSHDDAEDHRKAWAHRFYAEVAHDLQPILSERGIEASILIGTPKTRYLFEQAIPASLRQAIVGTGPGLPHHDAGPSEILAAAEGEIAGWIRERKLARIQQLREHGVLGLDACLSKLQLSQLERVFVPWNLDAEVFVDIDTGYVATTAGQARIRNPNANASVRSADAREELIRLADAHGTTVEFTNTGTSDLPFDDIEDVAGLLRWSETPRKTG